jgi:organic radical activating enzyme
MYPHKGQNTLGNIKSRLRAFPAVDRYARKTSARRSYDRLLQAGVTPTIKLDTSHFRIGEIEINNNCNLDCVMCNPSSSSRERGPMPLDLFERSVVAARDLGDGRTSLHTIGEPLLNPRLKEYLDILRKQRVRIFLSTNAHLLKKRMDLIFQYSDVIDELRFSIDGATQSTYEKIRRPGKFDNLIMNLDAFTEANGNGKIIERVRIDSIVSEDVKDELAYHIKFYSKYVSMDRIRLCLVSGLSPDNSYFLGSSVLKNHIVPWRPCEQLFQPVVHILNDGSVSVCCRDYHGEMVCGNIRHDDPRALVNGETLVAMRKRHLNDTVSPDSLCGNCYRVDPAVSELFEAFVTQLVARYSHDWDVGRMQAKFDRFFESFSQGIPSRKAYMRLCA